MDDREQSAELDLEFRRDPANTKIAAERNAVLDSLAVEELGLVFRYIPAGPFEMGSGSGEPDEQPVHTVELDGFWISETPVSWARYCSLMDWLPPPQGVPMSDESERGAAPPAAVGRGVSPHFFLAEENKLRLLYCGDRSESARGRDHHFADPNETYETKPVVSVSWQEVETLCQRHSNGKVRYRLPTEAEWEKASRGGLAGRAYAWGDEPATGRCDCDRYECFAIAPMRQYPPNSYGLYAMCGGVWEWTSDWYDSLYYAESPRRNPAGPAEGRVKVVRGGSWADSPDVATVSFRNGLRSQSWRKGNWSEPMSPVCGFRLCRVEL